MARHRSQYYFAIKCCNSQTTGNEGFYSSNEEQRILEIFNTFPKKMDLLFTKASHDALVISPQPSAICLQQRSFDVARQITRTKPILRLVSKY